MRQVPKHYLLPISCTIYFFNILSHRIKNLLIFDYYLVSYWGY